MTRINAAIEPAELCDQMLLAEVRELPRMAKMCWKRVETYNAKSIFVFGPRPEQPTLGKGHMAYFVPFGEFLCQRHESLVQEAKRRGFKIEREPLRPKSLPVPCLEHKIPQEHLVQARAMLIERIKVRLGEMKRQPKWTATTPPSWASRVSP